MSSRYMSPIEVSGEQAAVIRAELRRPPTKKELAVVHRAQVHRLPRRKHSSLYDFYPSETYAEVAASMDRND